MKDYVVKGKTVNLEPSQAGFGGHFVWLEGVLRGEVFRGASGRYWWATRTGHPPYHQADDLGSAIEFLMDKPATQACGTARFRGGD